MNKLKEIFDSEIVKYSEQLFNGMCSDNYTDCTVVLTEDVLTFLESIKELDIYNFINGFSSNIVEYVYISYMGEPIFPLNEFQTALSNQREFKTDDIFDSFEFYTLSSIEDILTNVTAHGKGFRGILDSYGAVEYDIFHQLFIYSMLKIKNNKY